MDPLEMEIKWLHSPMMKIADALENKTTVCKVLVPFLHGNPFLYLGLCEVVCPFCLAPTRSAYNGGEMRVVLLFPVGSLGTWWVASFVKKWQVQGGGMLSSSSFPSLALAQRTGMPVQLPSCSGGKAGYP